MQDFAAEMAGIVRNQGDPMMAGTNDQIIEIDLFDLARCRDPDRPAPIRAAGGGFYSLLQSNEWSQPEMSGVGLKIRTDFTVRGKIGEVGRHRIVLKFR